MSTGTGPGTHGKIGLEVYQHDNRKSSQTSRVFTTRTIRERDHTNVYKETEIGNAKLLSRCTLDITSLTTASMDFSLPSIGISAAPSIARTSIDCSKTDEVTNSNEIKIENKKIVSIAMIKKGEEIKKGEGIKKYEEVKKGEEVVRIGDEIKKGEEMKESEEVKKEEEGEQGEMKLNRKENEEEVEVEVPEGQMTGLPANLSTIPNRCCSLIEAQGLKELIFIPTGNHIL